MLGDVALDNAAMEHGEPNTLRSIVKLFITYVTNIQNGLHFIVDSLQQCSCINYTCWRVVTTLSTCYPAKRTVQIIITLLM